ncbi:hypothetical protein ACQ0QQ_04510 [Lysinibacillus sphaericus]
MQEGVILLNGLNTLPEEKLKKILVDSKRVGTSKEFIKLIEAAILHRSTLK